MKTRISIAVIGLGRLGRTYAEYVAHRIPNARLPALCDVDEKILQSCTHELGVSSSYKHYQDLLGNKEIDAVVIVTPTKTHRDIVIDAAKEGKAIFCEKPLSLSLEEATDMLKAVEGTGAFFHMGFMRRFDKGYAAAKKKLEQGAIGRPVVLKSSSRDPYRPSLEYANPENSGGLITDMGIHDFDLARWFMGEVRSVYSVGGTLAYPEMKSIGDIDNAIINMYFADGALGVVDLSRNGVYGYDIRTEILGTNGTLKIGYLRQTPLLVMKKEGVTHDTVPYFFERFEEAYVSQLRDFADSLLSGREPSIKCVDGVAALQISWAATRSFTENHPVDVQAGVNM